MARSIFVNAYGIRNAKGDPLTTDTVMYGASLTKTVFAYTVMQLVDQGKIDIDKPIKNDLDNPLPSYGPDPVFPDKYGPYKDLADDPRWETDHSTDVPQSLHRFQQFLVHRTRPEAAHPLSAGHPLQLFGEGFILLQFVVEHGRKAQGLGLDVGELTKANFDRLGMTRTSLTWRNGLGPQRSRRMERPGPATTPRQAQQGARCGVDEHDDH